MQKPPPLRINKDSHAIQKSSSSSASTGSTVTVASSSNAPKPPQRHPVIIYTHSPKVIHTHPRDFMALVQKLTGFSRSDEDVVDDNNNNNNNNNEERRVEVAVGGGGGGESEPSDGPLVYDPPNPYVDNIPPFTPNSEFFCSMGPMFYRYQEQPVFVNPSGFGGSSISPSLLKVFKSFPEY
ncbi:hypothetical protein QJS10_CPB14g00349 [Acorus calamus]|uniref:VQ domain-containing protein n=1 Tax=Acorus calamus TaxID=4465 RepID=A0AAV9DB37_ACOCL|nr:hypothetical protein QJS10_CPB14g00349 [Acorus calamus]